MSKVKKPPKYSLHKPSGQARVLVNGKHIYLGKYGSAESRQKYADIVVNLESDSLASLADAPSGHFSSITVDEVLFRYLQYARGYYAKNGQPSKEYHCMIDAIKHLRPRFGDSPAEQFGPRKLAIVREDMIRQGLVRTVINNRVNRIRRVFKWAVSMELLPPAVYQGLSTLDGLNNGRLSAFSWIESESDDQGYHCTTNLCATNDHTHRDNGRDNVG